MLTKLLFSLTALLAVPFPLALADPSCNATTSCGPRPKVGPCRNVFGTFSRLDCVFNNSTQSCVWERLSCPVCDATNCGPRPGILNFLCPDGKTIAGPSESCKFIVESGTCGYPIITCPVCNATTCGAKPLFEIKCPDGSIVGAGPCVFNNKAHKCEYEFPKCPPRCNSTSCGPKVDKVCPDGTAVAAGPCVFNEDDQMCEFKYPKCPPICNATTCGKAPKVGSRLCPDGTTIRTVGPCRLDNDKKKCIFPIVDCPRCKTTADCVGTDVYCSTDHFCRASATCSSNKDCINPDNHYAITALLPLDCVGCTSCMKGVCGRECIPCQHVCHPPNSNFTNCDACSRVKKCQRCVSSCV